MMMGRVVINRFRRRRRGRKKHSLDVCDCDFDCCGCDLPLIGWLALSAPTRAPSRVTGPARAGIVLIRGYQRWLSARLPTHCPHTPTCSNYGLGAVSRYGLWQGSRLTAGRLRRCSGSVPRGTADPVP
jgi:hypothetical protein